MKDYYKMPDETKEVMIDGWYHTRDMGYLDENGYMWIGTYDGLNLYNGKNTYVFRFEPNNKNTLCSNIINKIVYGGDGFLWVSTSMGLNRFSLKDRKVNV